MPVAIVDGLELVQVDEQQRTLGVVAASRQVQRSVALETAAIQHAG